MKEVYKVYRIGWTYLVCLIFCNSIENTLKSGWKDVLSSLKEKISIINIITLHICNKKITNNHGRNA